MKTEHKSYWLPPNAEVNNSWTYTSTPTVHDAIFGNKAVFVLAWKDVYYESQKGLNNKIKINVRSANLG